MYNLRPARSMLPEITASISVSAQQQITKQLPVAASCPTRTTELPVKSPPVSTGDHSSLSRHRSSLHRRWLEPRYHQPTSELGWNTSRRQHRQLLHRLTSSQGFLARCIPPQASAFSPFFGIPCDE
ncbi:unnamed protein product [Lactuca virosa]|uniref:Uncharacterized protein n=1 Tax=Lactuca virosa TaxID=75947 RepID=A0AAU9M3R9_9ASTR|nr:unnamed protein product [Lactuca virosa]